MCWLFLQGGLLSDYWVDRPAPDLRSGPVSTRPRHCAQLQKYLRWVELWGGWALFQALLRALRGVGRRHGVSLAAVARRWVLDQPAVRSIVVCATEQGKGSV
jgi:aryl-alcohol dehydrogenase-like predicted oxidoreductase